ncbi:UNVERIFIED_CONTAM: hypothetical protein PYX00_000422 [Menopon gallinae]|uniref:Thioredoxin domain-containing protein n=1 Tax=Menopon gallinae TaxID=328185 RepID=A0AAW2I8Y4_9NEOP
MSNLVTERDDEEQNLSIKEETKNHSAAMFLYFRELFLLLAFIFSSYAALFISSPKIGKPPSPTPFFSKNSVVSDYYKGTVNLAFQRASKADLTVIMYYAPWDAESQAVRSEYEAAAHLLHEEVFFTAISCWSPNMECKQHTPRIKHFPVIVAYPQHLKGIQYKGAILSTHLVQFVKTLMRPLHRIQSPLDIAALIAQHDVVIVGSFSFSGNLGGPGYYTFYSAAIKMLEKDPYNDIAFAVTTDRETATSIDIEVIPSIHLYLWNETYEYPTDAHYSDESLVKWIWTKIHQPVFWISPPGVKSQMLSRFLSNGPTLIVFTPRNPLFKMHAIYSMLKGVALRYYNCNNSTWVDHLAKFIEISNLRLLASKKSMEKYCSKRKRSDCKTEKEDVCEVGDFHSMYIGPQSEVCTRKLNLDGFLFYKNRDEFRYETSILPSRDDERSPENLLRLWDEEKCKLWTFANRYQKQIFPKTRKENSSTVIDGLACVNKKTLSIIALDSLLYHQFAEGIGINILELKDKTAIAIVDKEEESQYVLSADINKNSVASFIANHTYSMLRRFLRSTKDSSSRSITRFRYPVREESKCKHTDKESCVPELNSDNFLNYVMNQTRAVIVFYHSPYCALCRSISHLFLLLARYFRHFPGIQFARVDGDNNDLPWEYTMEYFPTILFFPTIRKSDSRIYSSDLPFTIRNLIHFTLANLEPEAKIPAMVSLCISFEKLQNDDEARKCKSKVQRETYENLAKTLKHTRLTMLRWKDIPPSSVFLKELRKRQKILIHKLDYFKTIHFMLGSVEKIRQNSNFIVDIIKLYNKFLLLVQNNSYYLSHDELR